VDEERVALGLGVDGAHQLLRRGLAGEGGEQLGHLGGGQAGQGAVLGRAGPARVDPQLGQDPGAADVGLAVAAEHQQRRRGGPTGQLADDQQGGRIRPVEVVQDQQGRGGPGHRDQQPLGGLGDQERLGLRLQPRRAGQVRDPLGQPGQDPGEHTPGRAQLLAQLRPGHGGHVRAQRLDQRLVGAGRLLVAAAVQHQPAPLEDDPGQAGGQPGLADAGVAGQQRDPPPGRRPGAGGLLPQALQPGQLRRPANQRAGRCRGQGLGEGELGLLGGPVDRGHRHRLGDPLEGPLPQRREPMRSPGRHQRPGDVADQDLTAVGGRAQPGRDHHRHPEEAALVVHQRLPRVDPDPHPQRLRLGVAAVVAGRLLLHHHPAGDGVHGAREGDHQPVAGVVDDLAGVVLGGLAQHVDQGLADPLGAGVPQPLQLDGGPGLVSEEEGDGRHRDLRAGRRCWPGRAGSS
jgi:hypothetical protein